MRLKRTIFIVSLCILFLVCYMQMASKIDPFARYSYINEDNEEIIRKYITNPNDIDYIISLKIEPSQFLEFIEFPDFKVKNILYYETCKKYRPIDNREIVKFVNEYRNNYSVANFELIIQNYEYETLKDYFDNGYAYFEDADIVENPSRLSLIFDSDDVVLDYTPIDLLAVESTLVQIMPSIEGKDTIYLREGAYNALKDMMEAFAQEDYELYRALVLTNGYISYEEQVTLYEAASQKYDEDLIAAIAIKKQEEHNESQEDSKDTEEQEVEVSEEEKIAQKAETLNKIIDLPGRSENQLGYTIMLKINGFNDIEDIKKSEQYKWLSEHAHKYGYIFRYPEDKEGVTGKTYQVLTLRYVGVDNAKEVHNTQKAFDEIKAKDE